MKKLNPTIATWILFSVLAVSAFGQSKSKLLLSLSYHNNNNQTQYLEAQAKSKVKGRLTLVPGLEVRFYINQDSSSGFLGKAFTDELGSASILIPAAAKVEWDKSTTPGFIAQTDETKDFTAGHARFDLTKARLKIDTGSDRKVTVTLLALKDSNWLPIKGVDIKIAVKRQGGDLNVGSAPTYTTDSLGVASADFAIGQLPGDSRGALILVAKVDDNDTYGNLSVEKSVPWGTPKIYQSTYDERTLFSRRGKSPFWLDLIAYSILVAVWGVLVYLIFQIRKLKSLGAQLD